MKKENYLLTAAEVAEHLAVFLCKNFECDIYIQDTENVYGQNILWIAI